MLLKNTYKVFCSMVQHMTAVSSSAFYLITIENAATAFVNPLTKYDKWFCPFSGCAFSRLFAPFYSYGTNGYFFGAGGKEPSLDDVALETPIENLTVVTSNILTSSCRQITFDITNNNDEDVTIREYIYGAQIISGTYYKNYNYGYNTTTVPIAFERGVLDNPITIKAHESGLIIIRRGFSSSSLKNNNWQNVINTFILNRPNTVISDNFMLKNLNGDSISWYTYPTDNADPSNLACMKLFSPEFEVFNSETNLKGYRFGTGTTPPSAEDYNLEAPLDETTTNVKITKSNISNGVNLTFTIENNGENPIIVTEWGRFSAIRTGSSTSSALETVMFERELLEIPVTIAPGETGTVILKVTVDSLLS